MKAWLSLPEVARLAGVSRTAIAKAVHRALANPNARWRGTHLIVRIRHGRGGKAGQLFEVASDSLPDKLKQSLPQNDNGAVSQAVKIAVLEALLREARDGR